MEIKVKAQAGTLESSDVYVIIEPSDKLEINVKSTVLEQFKDDILKVVNKTLEEFDIKKANIQLEDKGAMDVVIKSRLQTAIMRACQSKEYIF